MPGGSSFVGLPQVPVLAYRQALPLSTATWVHVAGRSPWLASNFIVLHSRKDVALTLQLLML